MDCRNIYCTAKNAKKYTHNNAEKKGLKLLVKFHYILRTEDEGFFKMSVCLHFYVCNMSKKKKKQKPTFPKKPKHNTPPKLKHGTLHFLAKWKEK